MSTNEKTATREDAGNVRVPEAIPLDEYRNQVGMLLGVSDWIVIEQGIIDQFADVTRDWQFIHIDPVRAKETPFGGTIAHGLFTLSLVSAMSFTAVPAVACGGVSHSSSSWSVSRVNGSRRSTCASTSRMS